MEVSSKTESIRFQVMNGQELLDAGTHKLCGCGRTLIRVKQPACEQCGRTPPRTTPAPTPAVRLRRQSSQRGSQHVADARVRPDRLGGLGSLPDNTLWLVAHGNPVQQGSVSAPAAGVIKREKGPKLEAWRNAIHRQLIRAAGLGFVAADCPVRMHVVFTMPGPRGTEVAAQTTKANAADSGLPRLCPSTKPDLDKLVRAVGDALSPRGDRMRVFADDSRIVELLTAESFAAPQHVHPWALPCPGVVIRVCPVDVAAPFPALSLTNPGEVPDAVAALLPLA